MQRIWTHLGFIETKIGILEKETNTLVTPTRSRAGNLIPTVQDLMDKTGNNTEVEQLTAQVTN